MGDIVASRQGLNNSVLGNKDAGGTAWAGTQVKLACVMTGHVSSVRTDAAICEYLAEVAHSIHIHLQPM